MGTHGAMAAIHKYVRDAHRARRGTARAPRVRPRRCGHADLLGLDPLDPQWLVADAAADAATGALGTLVEDLLAQRQEAREHRDFATADAVRARLTAAGVSVEDSADGPTWSLKDV